MCDFQVTSVSFNQEGNRCAVGMLGGGFAIFSVSSSGFILCHKKYFDSTKPLVVPLNTAGQQHQSTSADAQSPVKGGGSSNSVTAPFWFQVVSMLHDSNLIALVGSTSPVPFFVKPCDDDGSGVKKGTASFTKVFSRDAVVIWDMASDSLYIRIPLCLLYPTAPPSPPAITSLSWFRLGFLQLAGARGTVSVGADGDNCEWPEGEEGGVGGSASDLASRRVAQQSPSSQRFATGRNDDELPPVFPPSPQSDLKPKESSTSSTRNSNLAPLSPPTPLPDRIYCLVKTASDGVITFTLSASTVNNVQFFPETKNRCPNPHISCLSPIPQITGSSPFCIVATVPAASLGAIRVERLVSTSASARNSIFEVAHKEKQLGLLGYGALDFVPEGRKCAMPIATVSEDANSVHLYKLVAEFSPSSVTSVEILKSRSELRRARINNKTAGLATSDKVECLAFSQSNLFLACGTSSGTVYLYRVPQEGTDGDSGGESVFSSLGAAVAATTKLIDPLDQAIAVMTHEALQPISSCYAYTLALGGGPSMQLRFCEDPTALCLVAVHGPQKKVVIFKVTFDSAWRQAQWTVAVQDL